MQTKIVIRSWENYESKALNIIKACLNIWQKKWYNERKNKAICPIAFNSINIESGKRLYFVTLTNEQYLGWGLSRLSENDKFAISRAFTIDDMDMLDKFFR